jgi:predicted adenine nucleotide alpha hydrolase (AANH) superfamily ATPase
LNILLHACCAPCAIFPVEELKKGGHKIAGFFYNPNIHPYSEYLKRRGAAENYFKSAGVNLISGDYDIEYYFQHIVYNEALDNRCPVCWWIRLEKTARFAKENGFDAFTTTLLASPYQDQTAIKNICDEIVKNTCISFHYQDFRSGFKASHERAKREGIYCQNYCGCVFSEKERLEKKRIGN